MLGINVENILARVEHMVATAQASHTFWEKQACRLVYYGNAFSADLGDSPASWVVRVQKVNGAGVTCEVISFIGSRGLPVKGAPTSLEGESPRFHPNQMIFIPGTGKFELVTLSQEEGEMYLEPNISTSKKRVDIDLTKSGLMESDS